MIPDLSGRAVVVLHAHPDDEAILTGLTLRRLADAGARVLLVMATGGEQGQLRQRLSPGESVRGRRLGELALATHLLGVHRVLPLGFRDSGAGGDNADPLAFVHADPEVVARVLAGIVLQHNADALIHDDTGGLYGHPDHLVAHHVGRRAAQLARVTSYEATVDRDHLAARASHLVHRASEGRPIGRPRAGITTSISGDERTLRAKRKAMLVHASQISPDDVTPGSFADVYGTEWYVRHGAPGVLDLVADGVGLEAAA